MKKRIITAIVMIVLFVPLIVFESKFTRVAYFCVATFFSGVAAFEVLSSMYKESPELKIYRFLVPVLAGLVCASLMGATYLVSLETASSYFPLIYGLILYVASLLIFAFSNLLVYGAMIFTKNSQARAIMGCTLALTYGGLLLGLTFSLRYFKPLILNSHSIFNIVGIKSFLYVYLIVAITDTFAYLFGRKLGKHKLCPNISPNKSVEGAVFGLIFGTIAGTLVFIFAKIITPSTTIEWVLGIICGVVFSAITSALVQIGDLVESKLKRSFEVKDFGNIFPGHGGVLDRFDSFLYAGAWYFVVVQIVQIIIYWSN